MSTGILTNQVQREGIMLARSIADRRKAQGIGEAADAWKEEHEKALAVRDIEEVLVMCDELVLGAQNLQDRAFADLFANPKMPVARFATVHLAFIEQAKMTFARVGQAIGEAQAAGFQVQGQDRLERSLARLEAVEAEFLRGWPLLPAGEIQKGAEQIHQGQCTSAEELFRELADHPR